MNENAEGAGMAKVVHLAEGVTIPHLAYYATDVEIVELNELFDGMGELDRKSVV